MRVTRLWLLATVLTGCFYTDPINQRPSVSIHHTGAVSRGAKDVEFTAVTSDPDGDTVAVGWRAYACNGTACDAQEFLSGIDTSFRLPMVPLTNADGTSYDTLEIRLEGRDALGATARPSQTLDIHLDDAAPMIQLHADPGALVTGTPIGIYALVTDPDDDVTDLPPNHPYPVVWSVTPPPTTQDTYDLATVQVAGNDSTHRQEGKRFTPHGTGDWTIHVTATDPLLAATTQDLMVHATTDQLPCVAQWTPAATTDPGTTLPLTDPTLFQVLVVADDLDPYPSVPNDPVRGTTEFHWSIVPPGGSRQALPNVTGNAVALDPDSYTPGDVVELRVEIQDRNHRAVSCPDGDLTCSLTPDPACSQRLTWRVEVR